MPRSREALIAEFQKAEKYFTQNKHVLAYTALRTVVLDSCENKEVLLKEYINQLIESPDHISEQYKDKELFGPVFNLLGMVYRQGKGVDPCFVASAKCYNIAVRLGYLPSCLNAAYLYSSQGKLDDARKCINIILKSPSSMINPVPVLEFIATYMSEELPSYFKRFSQLWTKQHGAGFHDHTMQYVVEENETLRQITESQAQVVAQLQERSQLLACQKAALEKSIAELEQCVTELSVQIANQSALRPRYQLKDPEFGPRGTLPGRLSYSQA
tara:strand:+ start:579 stop:1391 length:813 start_codon:yes stop_codon:yes gene_type:complete